MTSLRREILKRNVCTVGGAMSYGLNFQFRIQYGKSMRAETTTHGCVNESAMRNQMVSRFEKFLLEKSADLIQ